MAKRIPKTNALRLLETHHIAYEVVTVPFAADGHVLLAEQDCPYPVYKTLVCQGKSGQYYVCVIPLAQQVALKELAALLQEKSIQLVPLTQLTAITGYLRGGCSPIGMKQLLPTVCDSSLMQHEKVMVSAGKRGVQMIVRPQDLMALTNARIGTVTSRSEENK